MIDDFKWEWVTLRIHPCICLFGWPLFGGWIPFIGFTYYWNDEQKISRCFMFEWFTKGIAFESITKDNEDE